MIWVSLGFSVLVLSLQSVKLLRQRLWTDLVAQFVLLGVGIGFATAISFGWWASVDVLAPLKLVFTPLSNWMYTLV